MKRILFCLFFCSLLFSCNSDDDSQNLPTESNFYALTVGNSWVYKYYELNILDNTYSFNNVVDSVSIVGTETINNNLYFKFKTKTSGNSSDNEVTGPWFNNGERFDFYRDSLGYFVNDTGTKFFSNQSTDEWIYSPSGPISYNFKLMEDTYNANTNAGLIECLDVRVKHSIDGTELPCINHRYFSDGIGEVMLTLCFLSSNNHRWLKKLDSYNIQ